MTDLGTALAGAERHLWKLGEEERERARWVSSQLREALRSVAWITAEIGRSSRQVVLAFSRHVPHSRVG